MKGIPVRFWIGTMVFMTTFTNYMLRVNINLSIVRMVRPKNVSAKIPYCVQVHNGTYNPKPNKNEGDPYDWNENIQNWILGSYYIGYIPLSLVAGLATEYVGSYLVILASTIASVVINTLIPISCHGGWGLVLFLRIVIGALGGLGYPAVNDLIAKWAPPKEKGKFLAAMMGNTLGTVVSFVSVGMVSAKFGWQWGFYTTSIIVGVYCIVFALITSSSPRTHKWISEEERDYILECQGTTITTAKAPPPYVKIFTSLPFWIMTLAQFTNLWSLFLLGSYIPKYMAQVLGYDIKASGFVAAAPSLARLICSFIAGSIGDFIRRKDLLRLITMRKIAVLISHIIASLCLFLIIPCGCTEIFVIILLIACQGFNGFVVIGHLQNPQDLSPNFAGATYGIMNAIGGFSGFLVNALNGVILTQWPKGMTGPHIIFAIGGILFCIGGVAFILLGKCDIQPWNEKKVKDEQTTEL